MKRATHVLLAALVIAASAAVPAPAQASVSGAASATETFTPSQPRTMTTIPAPRTSFPTGAATGTTAVPIQAPLVPLVDLRVRNPTTGGEVAFSVQVLLLLTVLSLAPSLLILVTSFLRISIVLDFVKRALSLQQVPPNQVLLGIAFFLTAFIMWPTLTEAWTRGVQPLSEGRMSVEEAYKATEAPFRVFMYTQMKDDPRNISLFMSLRGLPKPRTLADVPTYVLVPAFVLNELTIAFKMGIVLFIPFIVIDMVVASALMSMGMIMLPPVMISAPFKLILFVLVDGWNLLTDQLVRSFG